VKKPLVSLLWSSTLRLKGTRLIAVAAILIPARWSVAQSDSYLDMPGPIPLVVRYSGYLKEDPVYQRTVTGDQTRAVPNTLTGPGPKVVQVVFSLFKNADGGIPLWTEQQSVQLGRSGFYTVLLGSHSGGVPADLFANGDARWIEASSDGYLRSPRVPLLSVPYALKALNADNLAGHPASDYVRIDQLASLLSGPSRLSGLPRVRSTGTPNLIVRPPQPFPCLNCSETTETAFRFLSRARTGPSFISDATTGPAFQLATTDLEPNLNADFLHGLTDSDFAKVGASNLFSKNQVFQGGSTLPAMADAPANSPTGIPSSGLDLVASAFNTATNSSEHELLRWQAEAVNSDTINPSARLSLLFGSKDTPPSETGFSINPDGTLNFVARQQVPYSAIENALAGAGLVTVSSNPNDTVPAQPPIAYVGTADSWQQQPGGTNGIVPGSNTVTLRPCPKGVNGTDAWHYLYISGTGSPEAVLITGGSCKSGAASGTVQLNAANAHPPGYTLGSATNGLQESLVEAIGSNLQSPRNVVIDPGNYILHARLSIRMSNVTITASGASLTCAVQDTCVMVGDPANSNLFSDITIIGLKPGAGIPGGTFSAIEDNAEKTRLVSISPGAHSASGASFGHLIQVDNDQAALIDGLDTNGAGQWGRCDSTFCSSAIYGPGPFGTNAGVLWVQNSNLSFFCNANGIDNQDENTLHVSNTVVEGYAEFGIRGNVVYTTESSVQLDNVYEEVGNCTSPLGTGEAGLIAQGGGVKISGGVGPQGKLPQFANNGSTQYLYYAVIHDVTTNTVSAPYAFGTALSDGSSSINLSWPCVKSGTDAISYDILRDTPPAPVVVPYGPGNYAVAIGVPQGVGPTCTTVDTNAPLQPYSVADATFSPLLFFWPGNLILSKGAVAYVDSYFGGALSSALTSTKSAPSIVAQTCQAGSDNSYGPLYVSCASANPSGWLASSALLLQLGGPGASPTENNLKGRLIFEMPQYADISGPTHLITIVDSDPKKTAASMSNRPPNDPADTFIGIDNPKPVYLNLGQLSFGAPVSISNYIDNVGDGTNWLERLISAMKQFKVPLQLFEGSPPRCLVGSDFLWADSDAHRLKTCGSGGSTQQVVQSGADINVLDQVTNTHLSAPLPSAQGGFGANLSAAGVGTYPKANGNGAFAPSSLPAAGTGGCQNQVVVGTNPDSPPSCATVTPGMVSSGIAQTGVDINTAQQVTAVHVPRVTIAGPVGVIAPGSCFQVTGPLAGAKQGSLLTWNFAGEPGTSYLALKIQVWPTSNAANIDVCNTLATAVTPSAVSFTIGLLMP
jgi:hypothetical protein